jgi:competence protein ComEA
MKQRTKKPLGHRLAAALLVICPAIAFGGPVDINQADAATIARELSGIGISRAQAIVAYRESNGNFSSAEDILNVKGVGRQILDANLKNIRLSESG